MSYSKMMKIPKYGDLDGCQTYATYMYVLYMNENRDFYNDDEFDKLNADFQRDCCIDFNCVVEDAAAIQFYLAYVLENHDDTIESWNDESVYINKLVENNSCDLMCNYPSVHVDKYKKAFGITETDLDGLFKSSCDWVNMRSTVCPVHIVNGVKKNNDGTLTIIPIDGYESSIDFSDTLKRSMDLNLYTIPEEYKIKTEHHYAMTKLKDSLYFLAKIMASNDYFIYYYEEE